LTEPALAARARALAGAAGFDRSSSPEAGRLLSVLAASRPGGRLAEIGTGCGVGAAWLASGLQDGATLVTVELDPDRAEAAGALLAEAPGVEALAGDWHDLLPARAPFDLLFFDGGYWKLDPERNAPPAIELLGEGGLLVFDDMTPRRPEEAASDPVRAFVGARPDLLVTEVLVRPEEVVVLAARTMGGR